MLDGEGHFKENLQLEEALRRRHEEMVEKMEKELMDADVQLRKKKVPPLSHRMYL